MIDAHTHNYGNAEAVVNLRFENAEEDSKKLCDGQLFSMGIHPWDASEYCESDIARLRKLIEELHPQFVGEIGIDKVCGVGLAPQTFVFLRQMEMACEYGLPVIIHNVRASAEVASVIKKSGHRYGAVIHGVRCGLRRIEPLLGIAEECNVFFSFGARFERECLLGVPMERVLIETDEDGDINKVAESVGEALGIGMEKLEEIISNNFERLRITKG